VRPVPVPAIARALHPEDRPKVIAAPSGDLLDEDIAPVEALTGTLMLGVTPGPTVHAAPLIRLYLRPEGDDLDILREGGTIELTLLTAALPVFEVDVLPAN